MFKIYAKLRSKPVEMFDKCLPVESYSRAINWRFFQFKWLICKHTKLILHTLHNSSNFFLVALLCIAPLSSAELSLLPFFLPLSFYLLHPPKATGKEPPNLGHHHDTPGFTIHTLFLALAPSLSRILDTGWPTTITTPGSRVVCVVVVVVARRAPATYDFGEFERGIETAVPFRSVVDQWDNLHKLSLPLVLREQEKTLSLNFTLSPFDWFVVVVVVAVYIQFPFWV